VKTSLLPVLGSAAYAGTGDFAPVQAAPQTNSPVAAATVVCTDDDKDRVLYLTPAGTLATLTVTLPTNANSRINQVQTIVSSQILTALTISGAGLTILGNPTALLAGGSVSLKKVAANTWVRLT
jgi:hypothetical protein